jgi:hypothetical protein
LSNEERKKVLEARAKAKADCANNTNTGAGRNANNKQTTAAVNTQDSGSEEGEILVHAGNVAEVLRQKNLPNAPPEDARDHMSSRRSKSARINMLSSKRLYPSQQSRCIAKLKGHIGYFQNAVSYGRNELDSRADTCCLGATYHIIEYTGQVCEMHPYRPKYKPTQNVPVVKGVTAYDDEKTGKTYILCVNQGLYFGNDMKHSLLNQNQMRSNGVIVDDCPVHLSPDNSSTHSIYFPDEDIRIPLQLNGCMSHFVTRLPTRQEMSSCQWLVLTSDAEWDPYSSKFNDDENDALSRSVGRISTEKMMPSHESTELRSKSSVFSLKATMEHAMISGISNGAKLSVTAQELTDNWGVSLSNAEQTLKYTTQHLIRSAVNPIEKRYQTAIQQLRYRQLGSELGIFYSDTMFASKRSVNQNACGQIFVNKAGFFILSQ